MKYFHKKVIASVTCLSIIGCKTRNSNQNQVKASNSSTTLADESIWTTRNKLKEGLLQGLIYLLGVRTKLSQNNLWETEEQLKDINCDILKFGRTLDGTCNDLANPRAGSVGATFGRNINPANLKSPEQVQAELMDPNPREVSLELMTRGEFIPATGLNLMVTAWIQFMNHDWFAHLSAEKDGSVAIPLPEGDPLRSSQDNIIIPATAKGKIHNGIQTFKNSSTHWWDGSQVYGSNSAIANLVRDKDNFSSIAMVQDGANLQLPISGISETGVVTKGVELTGFNQNWWTGTSLLHNLFALEHNRVVKEIKLAHPEIKSSQKLYDIARLVVSAEMAKIHTMEWTPALLGDTHGVGPAALKGNWVGLIGEIVDPKEENKFINGNFLDKFKNIVVGGIVGSPKAESFGKAYSLTEEFSSVYRMHPLLPDDLPLRSLTNDEPSETVTLEKLREKDSREITKKHTFADLFYSMGRVTPGALTLNNFPKTLQNFDLRLPMFGKMQTMDLAAIDIYRDRERGIPRYNEFRRQMQLKPIKSFEDLTDDPTQLSKLKKVYDNDIEKIDLLIGSLAEAQARRPSNWAFGETSFQVFVIMASRRLFSDRFFTEYYKDKVNGEFVYTKTGLEIIRGTTMKSLLERNIKGLKESGVMEGLKDDNAFFSWKKPTNPRK